MKTVLIFSYKGGEGRTTTATNLAFNLSINNKKVLIIDADQQGNISYQFRRKGSRYSLYDVLTNKCKITTAVRRTAYENLDIIPADSRLERLMCDPDTLKNKLKEVNYDYCIIDCHPGYQVTTINALTASNKLVIPMQANSYSLESLKDVIGQLKAVEANNNDMFLPEIAGVLITMFHNNKTSRNIVNSILERCREENINHFENLIISYSTAVNVAVDKRKPLLKCRSKAVVTRDYLAFTKEFLEKED